MRKSKSIRWIFAPLLFVPSCSSSSTPAGNNAPAGDGGTALSGNLGALGPLQATVSSLFISNSGETLIYMSSAPITCDQLKVSRWLGGATKGSQVVEIVFRGPPTVGTIQVPPGEVNYAAGGRSSASEVLADSGSITISKAEPNVAVEGAVTAKYAGGAAIDGPFRATFCAEGQGY